MSFPGIEPFELPNGDVFEIVAPGVVGLPDWECPKIDFLVEDVAAARAEMEAKGVEFVRPIESTPEVGFVWTHFRAPDGHLYGLTSIEGHPGLKK